MGPQVLGHYRHAPARIEVHFHTYAWVTKHVDGSNIHSAASLCRRNSKKFSPLFCRTSRRHMHGAAAQSAIENERSARLTSSNDRRGIAADATCAAGAAASLAGA